MFAEVPASVFANLNLTCFNHFLLGTVVKHPATDALKLVKRARWSEDLNEHICLEFQVFCIVHKSQIAFPK